MDKLTGIKFDSNGAVSAGSKQDTSMFQTALDVTIAPIKVFTGDNGTYVTEKQAALSSIVGWVGGGLVGLNYGYRKGLQGVRPFGVIGAN
jgi:hypothetical protein